MLLSLEDISVHFKRPEAALTTPFWRRRLPRTPEMVSENITVLNQLALAVEENDFLAILGPSGSGKTTLLRTIAGLTTPSSGRIILNGKNLTQLPPHQRDVGFVFQNGGWYDHLNVEQHFQFDGLSQDDARQLMTKLDLLDVRHHQPGKLSGGQAQRLAIGRALCRERSVLLLDEPLSQLDLSIRESLRQLLRSIHAANRTLIYVTHDQNDAMLLATKIAVLHGGKIQQIGSPKELFENPNHRCVAEMIGQPTMQFFNSISDVGIELHVGVRPEAWRIMELYDSIDAKAEKIGLSVMATFVEECFLGHQSLLQFIVDGSSMSKIQAIETRSQHHMILKAGERYRLSVRNRDCHFFAAETGERVPSI